MLIKNIKAQDFMRYQYLEIKDLPAKGIIGIFGENESGKSTIGEVISFALFGATVRFAERSPTHLIHWDAEQCEVEVTFVAEDQHYTVVRSIDRNGELRAILYKGDKEAQLKTGASVTQEIELLTKFTFDNFRYTFYLAQKEIDVVQEMREKAHDVVQKMMGFDLLAKASETMQKENEQGLAKKDKCDSEILVNRSVVLEIKADSSSEKNLATQTEKLESRKKQLEEAIALQKSKVQQTAELIENHEKLCASFATLERSFNYYFHKEKTAQNLQNLSHIYAAAKEEMKAIAKLTEKNQKQKKSFEHRLEQITDMEKRIRHIINSVQSHGQNLQKRLTVPEKKWKQEMNGNLQAALWRNERRRESVGKLGWTALVLAAISSFTAVLGVLNMLWAGWWFIVAVVCSVLAGFMLWGVFALRKKLNSLNEVHVQIVGEIEKLQGEVDACLHFPTQNLAQMQQSVQAIHCQAIQEHMDSMKSQFPEIFSENSDIDVQKKDAEQQRAICDDQQKTYDQRFKKVEILIKLVEGLGKDVDLSTSATAEDYNLFKNLDELEKKVYNLLEEMQEHRATLREFEAQPPAEIEVAWQEYERNRNKFRTLSGMTSIGGGTGMLTRIQSVFRQKTTTRKLSDILTMERDTFFSSIPSHESLTTTLRENQEVLSVQEKEVADCAGQLKEKRLEHQKCLEELERKKNMVNKLSALLRQKEELERSIAVNTTAVDLMKQTTAAVSLRFAPSISRIMSRVMPHVTKGRYKNVQVTPDLMVKAYSQEKNDFVDLAELSGGTVDQLFLSLRLAFAQAVLTAKLGKGCKQFLFFDEPIISFDEERSQSFLNLLADYNKNFAQVFVISPRSFQTDIFDVIIQTMADQHQLVVSAKKTSPATPPPAENDDDPEEKPATVRRKKRPPQPEENSGENKNDIRIEYDEENS